MPLLLRLFSLILAMLLLGGCMGSKASGPVEGTYQFRLVQDITPTIPLGFQKAKNTLEVDGRYWKEDGHLMIEGTIQKAISDLPGVDLVYTPDVKEGETPRFIEQLLSEINRIPFDFEFLPGDQAPTLVNEEWGTKLLQATYKVGKPKGRYERLAENHLKADNIEAFAVSIAGAFPGSVYTKGEEWTSDSEVTLISQHQLSTVYTFKDRKRYRDQVSIISTITPMGRSGTIQWNGMTFALEVTGTVKGEMEISRGEFPVLLSASLMQDLSAVLRPIFSGMDNLPGVEVKITGPVSLTTKAN